MSNDKKPPTEKYEPDLPAHAGINFEGVDRTLLQHYAEILAVPIKASESDEEIRQGLIAKLGNAFGFGRDNELLDAAPPVPQQKLSVNELFGLNLSGRGRWEGRRRIVVLARPENYKGDKPMFFGWGRQSYWLRPNVEISVPLPIFNIIRNMRPRRLRQVHKKLDDGSTTVRNIFTEYQRVPYSDLGDDPETSHLPISQTEQFRMLAGMTNEFKTFKDAEGKPKEFSEGQLRAVAKRLNLELHDLPPSGASDLIRGRILSKLKLNRSLEAIA